MKKIPNKGVHMSPTNQTSTHYFLAVVLPDQLKYQIEQACISTEITKYFKQTTSLQDLHITLQFLGALTDKEKEQLIEAINETSLQAATCKTGQLQTFGLAEKPRVLWVGLEHMEGLVQLQTDVAHICKKCNLQTDRRAYEPHITIAKKWANQDETFPKENKHMYSLHPQVFTISKIALYKINIHATPKYKIEYLFNL